MLHIQEIRKSPDGLDFEKKLDLAEELKERNPEILDVQDIVAKGKVQYEDVPAISADRPRSSAPAGGAPAGEVRAGAEGFGWVTSHSWCCRKVTIWHRGKAEDRHESRRIIIGDLLSFVYQLVTLTDPQPPPLAQPQQTGLDQAKHPSLEEP